MKVRPHQQWVITVVLVSVLCAAGLLAAQAVTDAANIPETIEIAPIQRDEPIDLASEVLPKVNGDESTIGAGLQPRSKNLAAIGALTVSSNGRFVACGRGNQIFVYHIPAGELFDRLRDPKLAGPPEQPSDPVGQGGSAHQDVVRALAFSSDGQLLASAGDRMVKLWRRPRHVQRYQFPAASPDVESNDSSVKAMAASPDGRWLAVGAVDNRIVLWDVTGATVTRKLSGHTASITDLSFSIDSQRLCSGSTDKTVRVWNVVDGVEVANVETTTRVNAVQWITDSVVSGSIASATTASGEIASGGEDGIVRIWKVPEAAAGTLVPVRELRGHGNSVTCLDRILSASAKIVSGSTDGTVRIWNIKDGQQVQSFDHGAEVTAVAARPNGQRIASGGTDNVAVLWNTESSKRIAELKGNHYLNDRAVASELLARFTESQTFYWQKALAEAELYEKSATDLLIKVTAERDAAIRNVAVREAALRESERVKANAAKSRDEAKIQFAQAQNKKNVVELAFQKASELATGFGKLEADLKFKAEALRAKAEKTLAAATQTKQRLDEATADAEAKSQSADKAKANGDQDADTKQKVADAAKAKVQRLESEFESKKKIADEAKVIAEKSAKDAANERLLVESATTAMNLIEQARSSVGRNLERARSRHEESEDALKTAEESLTHAEMLRGEAREARPKAIDRYQEVVVSVRDVIDRWVNARDHAVRAGRENEQAQKAWEKARQAAAEAVQPIRALAFSPDGQRLAIGGDAHTVSTFFASNGEPDESFEAHKSPVTGLAFTRRGELVSSSTAHHVITWNIKAPWELDQVIDSNKLHSSTALRVQSLALGPEGDILAVAGEQPTGRGQIQLWRVQDGSLVRTIPDAHGDRVLDLAFSRDGQYLASASADRLIKVFDVGNGTTAKSFAGHTGPVRDLSWHPNGYMLASGGADKTVWIWDFLTGKGVRSFSDFEEEVTSVQYIGYSAQTVITTADSKLSLYGENGERALTFEGSGAIGLCSAVSRDGRIIAGGGRDGILHVWNTDGRKIAVFTPPTESKPTNSTPLNPDVQTALLVRFESEIWPLLASQHAGKSCVGCHNADNTPSSLTYLPDVESNFAMLLDNAYFDPDDPSSLLARVTAPDVDVRMPPEPAPRLTNEQVQVLRTFTQEVFEATGGRKSRTEVGRKFPRELLTPWEGGTPADRTAMTFLTLRQLQGNIATIFDDAWRRNDKDMYAEYIHLFRGADFVTRHNESSEPTAEYLSALGRLGKDVASASYLQSTGPFRDRPESFPAPTGTDEPDDVSRAWITQLYRRILLRHPTAHEIRRAHQLLGDIYRESPTGQPRDLTFEVHARDTAAGVAAVKGFSLRVHEGHRGLHQQYIDQSVDGTDATDKKDPEGAKVALKLPGRFRFAVKDDAQMFRISNRGTVGEVSIAGIQLTGPAPDHTRHFFGVSDPVVEVAGPWSFHNGNEFASYEDGNRHKGKCSLVIPIEVERDGEYEVEVVWRKHSASSTKSVLIEIVSQDRTQLALPPAPPPPPPPGEAVFSLDQTDDTVAFWDSQVSFRFASDLDFVEINNAGTKRPVTADAVKFVPTDGGDHLLIDNGEAIGHEMWQKFSGKAYNKVGDDALTDSNQKKGELRLAYKPSTHKKWEAKQFYRVMISYPGKVGHEARTPAIVRAAASTPIIRLRHPRDVRVGADVELDATHTYNIQRSPLEIVWKQIGGPQVIMDDPGKLRTRFQVPDPKSGAGQIAWETLASALLMHPDFLFTRAPSLDTTINPEDRRRLQLRKIALDLVGRTPTEEEITKLEGGEPLPSFVDAYLKSDDFKSFYFHRVRLFLESHGTEEQDEPVRLWCYVAFNDLPFQEILTASYTVDPQMRRADRPAHHGQTGILTTKGFIEGKPGLPHFNYAAQVAEKFLGYIFEVPPEIEKERETTTAISTTHPTTTCYSCHKLLTPLAHQRLAWTDEGQFRTTDDQEQPIDDSDRGLVASYPFAGKGMEAFASQAVTKERFVRTMIDTHFLFFFGRQMRFREDERRLYKDLWDTVHADGFRIRGLISAIMTSPEYLQ